MTQGQFFDRLRDRIAATDSLVSVGLDADRDRLPDVDAIADAELPRWAFNRRIIDATHEHAAAYKPNVAFYEDADGWRALRETVAYAHGKDVPVLLDAKRGDVGNTARKYAELLDATDADAITVSPYLGGDSLSPFLSRTDAGVFVLCRTSNPGGADLQDLPIAGTEPPLGDATGEADGDGDGGGVGAEADDDSGTDHERLFERVARLATGWNERGNVGLVVGATAPEELERVRSIAPDVPFLVPGVGAQGGDLEAAATHATADGAGLVNSSRGIIFAGEGARGREEGAYFKAAGEAARRLKRRLNDHRNA
jgi:orotidine-5'-phosphate decarboxylase